MNREEGPEQEKARSLIESGADIVGGVTTTATGLLFGGPGGALAGAALGPLVARTLQSVGAELSTRILGPRGEARAGAALSVASVEINRRLEAGEPIRDDGFFDRGPGGVRAPADEIAEGVLWAAQQEHQERKVQYYGRLLANIAFDAGLSLPNASYLLRTAQDISYRQVALVAFLGRYREVDQAMEEREKEREGLSLDEAREVMDRLEDGEATVDEITSLLKSRLPAELRLELARLLKESDDPAVEEAREELHSFIVDDARSAGSRRGWSTGSFTPSSPVVLDSKPRWFFSKPILLAELRDLETRRLVNADLDDVSPDRPELSPIGKKLFGHMDLDEFPVSELIPLAEVIEF